MVEEKADMAGSGASRRSRKTESARLQATSNAPVSNYHFATALRKTWRAGYGWREFRADFWAGLIVSVVALPLSIALAIGAGVPPQYGIYSAIVAGILAALTGGAQTTITGPTAAFVVLLAPISAQFGLGGLTIATLMAGAILLLMGVTHFGRLIRYIPYPVTSGFTAGVGIVIASLQLEDLFGFVPSGATGFFQRIASAGERLGEVNLPDLGVGLFTLFTLIFWRKLTRKVPAPLIAIVAASLVAWGLTLLFPELSVSTIGSRFSFIDSAGVKQAGIPSSLPELVWPWHLPDASGNPTVPTLALLRELLGPAFAIAMLGAISSLLCAVVADGMSGSKHDSDAELVGQGIANLALPFFGGFVATGAIARTTTNVRAGGHSPIAAVVQSLSLLLMLVVAGSLLPYLPLSSLAALLLMTAWNMLDVKHTLHILRVAPRPDVLVFLTCITLTVVVDMVVAVIAGVTLAALLFMRRMADLATSELVGAGQPDDPALESAESQQGVLIYRVAGPLFFGAADTALRALASVNREAKLMLLDLSDVPVMDVTGLVALESALKRMEKLGVRVVITGVQPQPRELLKRNGVRERDPSLSVKPPVAMTSERMTTVLQQKHLRVRQESSTQAK